MIVWCQKDDIIIVSDKKPITQVRKPLPSDSKAIKKHKKKYPYLNKRQVTFLVIYLGKKYSITIKKGYKWNGANIPRLFWCIIGSMGDNSFLDASMVHDIVTEQKEIIDYDRQLSSMLLREILIASGVSKIKACTMYKVVDIYQKLCCTWSKE